MSFPTEKELRGSGGCFPAGTKIMTIRGIKPIEKIKEGDLVVGFDRSLTLSHGRVTKTYKHPKSENNSGMFTLKYETLSGIKELVVTGNHFIYLGEAERKFIEAKDLKVGDFLESYKGERFSIVEITSREIAEDEFTYNFEVSPLRTYIAEGIKVHNGGSGKGRQTQPVFTENPDTLRSKAIARLMEVISEGKTAGLVDGAKSIYFDNTPVQNDDDTWNFQDVAFKEMVGEEDQEPVPGFPSVEAESLVGVEVTPTIPVVRNISADADAARVTIALPSGLREQYTNSQGGGIRGSSVQIAIDVRLADGGTYVTRLQPTITGKATNSYETAYRIERPVGEGEWQIRVRRITPMPSSSLTTNNVFFSRVTEIQDIKLAYENTAYIAMQVNAQSTGGRVPTRSYDYKGILCRVPINYDPITREYDGTWNGQFKYAWTDNAAWVIYDILTNERYGLGKEITDDMIDKWSFYQVAQYNDELVDDGDGGTEPRFSFNYQFTTREDPWQMLQTIASSCCAVVYPASPITLLQDRPTDVSSIITNSSVIDGMFSYAGAPGSTRWTQVNVTFFDRDNKFLPRVITESATSEDIERYGLNVNDAVSFGCTSEGQARRYAKYIIDTSMNTTELLSFDVSFLNADLQPFDVIKVLDNDYVGLSRGGRVVGGTQTSIVVDRPVEITSGNTYTLTLVGADGASLIEKTLTNSAGSHTTLTFASALPGGITGAALAGRQWIVESTGDAVARPFRVLKINEVEKGRYRVSCVQYDPGKWARIEQGINVVPPTYSNITLDKCGAPEDIKFNLEEYSDTNFGNRVKLTISWDPPSIDNKGVVGYIFQYRVNGGNYSPQRLVYEREVELENIIPGTYDVILRTTNMQGVTSSPRAATFTYDPLVVPVSLFAPVNLQLAQGTGSGNEFYTGDLSFTWENNPLNEGRGAQQGYRIRIIDNSSSELLLEVNTPKSVTSYTYPFSLNSASLNGPHRSLEVQVFCLDAHGNLSDPANEVFTNEAPSAPTVTTVPGVASIGFMVNEPTEPDWAGIVIYSSTTSGFIPGPSNLSYKGEGLTTSIPAEEGSTVYYRVGVYDAFGNVDLNLSGEGSETVTAFNEYLEPAIPTGLTVTSDVVTQEDGSQTADLLIDWDANTENTVNYTLAVRNITRSEARSYIVTDAPPYIIRGVPCGHQFGVEIRANNVEVSSDYSAEVLHTTAVDNIPPPAPTALHVDSSFRTIFLEWVDPAAPDLKGIEIWASNGVNNRNLASKIATVAAGPNAATPGSYAHSGLGTGQTWYYWIRAFDESGNFSDWYPSSVSPSPSVGHFGTTVQTTNADYGNFSVTNIKIGNAAIDAAKIANASIQTAKIVDLAVTNAKIADLAVTTAKIGNLAVTNAKIADLAVDSAKIAAASIQTAHIADGQITTAKIQDATIIAAKIQNGAITNAKIANAAITEAKIANLAVTNAKIADGAITNAKIANAAIQNANIADGAITNAKIQNGAITNAKIANATIASAKIQDGAITNAKIGNLQVDTIKIADGAVSIQHAVRAGSTSDTNVAKNTWVNIFGQGIAFGSQPTNSKFVLMCSIDATVNGAADGTTSIFARIRRIAGGNSVVIWEGLGDVSRPNKTYAQIKGSFTVVDTPQQYGTSIVDGRITPSYYCEIICRGSGIAYYRQCSFTGILLKK